MRSMRAGLGSFGPAPVDDCGQVGENELSQRLGTRIVRPNRDAAGGDELLELAEPCGACGVLADEVFRPRLRRQPLDVCRITEVKESMSRHAGIA